MNNTIKNMTRVPTIVSRGVNHSTTMVTGGTRGFEVPRLMVYSLPLGLAAIDRAPATEVLLLRQDCPPSLVVIIYAVTSLRQT